MNRFIAACGINCEECDARKATVADDDALRAATAEVWHTQYGIPYIPISAINCTGCRMDGVKFAHCSECEIRICTIEKGYATCGDCGDLLVCSIMAPMLTAIPNALENLQNKE